MQRSVDITDIQSIGFDKDSVKTDIILARLKELRRNYKAAREPLEILWDDYYASYLTTPAAARRVSSTSAKRQVGDVNTAWRHRLKSPKAFETVETIVSWMMSAYFPNEYWFDIRPQTPMYDANFQQQLDVIKFFLSKGLDQADLKRKFRMFLRELCIAGTAAIAFPLVGESLKLDVMPCYSFYLDPESQDPNESNLIRNYTVSTIQLIKLVKDEYFNVAELKDIVPERGNNYNPNQSIVDQNLSTFMGIQVGVNSEQKYYHEVYEYWGNLICDDGMLINVRATFTDDTLLGIERNPFMKRPFVIGSYIPLARSPYGVGALQPIASQLYYKDILTSRHADNVAVASDTMLEIVQGQVLEPDKLTIRPGQKIMVTKPGSINPIVMPASNVAMQEMATIDQVIDKATGTGPYIGVNAGRSGDRVTAAEIAAQREAGGNRLTDVFSDIEVTVLLPLLKGYYYYLQQFATTMESVIRTPTDEYYIINGSAFQQDIEFSILGAANVADKEYRTRQLQAFLDLAGSNEQMAQRVNWDEAIKALAQLIIPDMAMRIVQEAPPPPAPEQQQMAGAPPMPGQDPMMAGLQEAAMFSGGGPGVAALQSTAASEGLPAAGERLRQQLMNPRTQG